MKVSLRIKTTGLLLLCSLLYGCKATDTPQNPDAPQNTEQSLSTETVESSSSPDVSNSQDISQTEESLQADNKALTIQLVNTCGVEIGMVSYINPSTKEQVDVGALPDGTLLNLDFVWPLDVSDFQWALYNADGVLCMECTTDISKAKTSATLILTGDNKVESVTAQFE